MPLAIPPAIYNAGVLFKGPTADGTDGQALVTNGSKVLAWATPSADLSTAVILAPGASTRNVIQPSGAAFIPLVVKGAVSQSANLLEFQNSAGTVLGDLSPDTTTLRLGIVDGWKLSVGSANTVGTYAIAVGHSNTISQSTDSALAVGKGCTVSGTFGVAIGRNCNAEGSGLALGLTAISTGGGIAIGFGASGQGPTAPANTLCVGSASTPVNNVYFGKGVTVHGTPTNVAINGTGGSGSDIAAGNLVLAAGRSTGSATPATLLLQAGVVGSTGSTLQTLATIVTIGTTTQNALIQTSAAATVGLVVKGSAAQSGDLLQVQNSSSTVMVKVAADGKVTFNGVGGATNSAIASPTGFDVVMGAADNFRLYNNGTLIHSHGPAGWAVSGTTSGTVTVKPPAIAGTQTYVVGHTLNVAADGATVTFDLALGKIHEVTLGGNRTLALSNPTTGQPFSLRLVQDGTGSRTVTWFSTIRWASGSTPTLTTTASKADWLGFVCTGAGTYDGFVLGQNL